MKLVLLFAATALAARGKPIHVAFEGNVIFGSQTLDSHRQKVHDELYQHCLDIGANAHGDETLTGGFDGEGFHFKYTCNCAHGNTKVPDTISIDSWWSAKATKAGTC
ncbi:hypothetical protein HZS61_008346 [Fusarium oxysporum f. sp. conglutinans]|uniref:Uncharacterized protein n=3 Tax=Fusarium oxysporum TaxID=5507 RepID=A0A8J5NNN9_FUSOX|nr:hypothetical protein FOXB_05522 [Fusarium oxysporum f. sp. conglutinans Fo5176]KAF6528044.1 hypothetical protein HZS61_008346 [Fusarium oxysporum f. sp. conglutinans]KAG7403186.1 hypothetical protein Forpe1208_v016636 [Fusarium oxysporum f. sp. rapae]KAG7001186.1 hypothetical protein FocnCong_v012868 [Fusarium oxysporum f. sp. conglutinans]KAG7403278.1 hypothetical protein Forpe1208_v016475 [Fusarium oxysporum f. sp. rapae]